MSGFYTRRRLCVNKKLKWAAFLFWQDERESLTHYGRYFILPPQEYSIHITDIAITVKGETA
jgi:hypothetical protein